MKIRSLVYVMSFWLVFFMSIGQVELRADQEWAPDFIIIGAQKSGTTSLYHYTEQHPLIVKTRRETHFFDLAFHKGVEWYQNQFSPRPTPHHLIGDKTPYYIFHPLVAERVFSLYPQVKIIMILRNPVDRAYSHYWHNIGAKREPLSFEEAIRMERSRLEGERKKLIKNPSYKSFAYQHYSYLARGIYVDQVKLWLSIFPKDQILILSSTDLKNKPDMVMKKVFAFLGLPNHQPLKPLLENAGNYSPMDPKTRQDLSDYFRPYNRQLEELLGRKFGWD